MQPTPFSLHKAPPAASTEAHPAQVARRALDQQLAAWQGALSKGMLARADFARLTVLVKAAEQARQILARMAPA